MRVLFVGLAGTRVAWYRCILPAMFMDPMQDWATLGGSPPNLQLAASWVDRSTTMPDLFDYDVVVLQQVRGLKWLDGIKKLQSAGVKVLYETDDYVHGVKDVPDHEFRGAYQKDSLKQIRMCMRACDGMIVSTQLLAELYKDMARKIYVCENGLDLGRYRLSKPPKADIDGHEAVTILWSGATGHRDSVYRWLTPVSRVMSRVPYSTFMSIGKAYSDVLKDFDDRTLTIPFSALETYPSAMMAGDVAIAPAGQTPWHRSKSQLRAMEAMALGIPVVGDPFYRETIEPYNGGFVAESAAEIEDLIQELVVDEDLRGAVSEAARTSAHEHFGMQSRVHQWTTALTDVLDRPSVR